MAQQTLCERCQVAIFPKGKDMLGGQAEFKTTSQAHTLKLTVEGIRKAQFDLCFACMLKVFGLELRAEDVRLSPAVPTVRIHPEAVGQAVELTPINLSELQDSIDVVLKVHANETPKHQDFFETHYVFHHIQSDTFLISKSQNVDKGEGTYVLVYTCPYGTPTEHLEMNLDVYLHMLENALKFKNAGTVLLPTDAGKTIEMPEELVQIKNRWEARQEIGEMTEQETAKALTILKKYDSRITTSLRTLDLALVTIIEASWKHSLAYNFNSGEIQAYKADHMIVAPWEEIVYDSHSNYGYRDSYYVTALRFLVARAASQLDHIWNVYIKAENKQ